MVHCYLVDNGLYDDIYLRAVGVVGRTYVVYTVVADKVVENGALTLLLWVIYRDRVTTEVLNEREQNIIKTFPRIAERMKEYFSE